jgi:heat-inducible transcriptional repressor
MADERKFAVLQAIIQDYVSTQEPVGSKSLVERHNLKVSPATIRNDMAALEDEGLIVQPHTSAGRIPTDQGYRYFVDRLNEVRPLSASEQNAISKFLSGAVDLDDVMQRTVRLLAQMTGQVALVKYPSLSKSILRHFDLVLLNEKRLMIMLVANTGRLEQAVLETSDDISDDLINDLKIKIKDKIIDKKFSEIQDLILDLKPNASVKDQPIVQSILQLVIDTAIEPEERRVAVGGASNLVKLDPDFSKTLLPVLDQIEENVVLLKLLGELSSPEDLKISIGSENLVENLRSASVVSSGYGNKDLVSQLAVVGPTRMDYPNTISNVTAIARYLGKILSNG